MARYNLVEPKRCGHCLRIIPQERFDSVVHPANKKRIKYCSERCRENARTKKEWERMPERNPNRYFAKLQHKREYLKKWRANHLSTGNCPRCGQEQDEPNRKICSECREALRK